MSERESVSALASLGGPVAMPDAEVLERQHQQVLPELRTFVRGLPARRRRQRLRRWALQVAGVAVTAALAVGLWYRPGEPRSAYVVERGHALTPARDHEFETSDAEPATLRTRSGARVQVGVATRIEAITSDDRHEEVRLARGSLQLVVPKLASGQSFSVRTPDAKVTVHGTVFSVALSGAQGESQTCVAVREGLVSVERGGVVTFVKGGEQSNCTPKEAELQLAVPSPATRSEAPAPLREDTERPAARSAEPRPPTSAGAANSKTGVRPHDGSLAAQNALLAEALQAERAGRYADARSRLTRLLSEYPTSALRVDAERSLERVSRKLR